VNASFLQHFVTVIDEVEDPMLFAVKQGELKGEQPSGQLTSPAQSSAAITKNAAA
jgi:hypothetical protein